MIPRERLGGAARLPARPDNEISSRQLQIPVRQFAFFFSPSTITAVNVWTTLAASQVYVPTERSFIHVALNFHMRHSDSTPGFVPRVNFMIGITPEPAYAGLGTVVTIANIGGDGANYQHMAWGDNKWNFYKLAGGMELAKAGIHQGYHDIVFAARNGDTGTLTVSQSVLFPDSFDQFGTVILN